MSFSYLVLGAGRQGTAAAYDLLRFGDARRVTLADHNAVQAQNAAGRLASLASPDQHAVIDTIIFDAANEQAAFDVMQGYDVVLSAVPYRYNLGLSRAAIRAGASFCDLGGNTELVRQQHALHKDAKQAGVRIVPDCGMGPGMGNTLAVHAMSLLDDATHVSIFDGGLPENPRQPWRYESTFNIEGLANEYYGGITVLRDGKLTHLPCFSELEMITVPGIGTLEAFVVAGGVSTAPWSFLGQLETFQLKILRYPGTFTQLKAFSDLGLFSPEPITVEGMQISPRAVFKALYEPQVRSDDPRDVCIILASARGTHDGKSAEATVQLIDRFDEATGFTAMERTTGWHASIVAIMLARGEIPVGAIPLELALPGDIFVKEARRRGLTIEERLS
ncbi:MAG: saccharopine dehydrogenase C-terminal domain-containing protein [Chloroflexota bacterium]|nr:saccharopine dehydrogenase C-terminal domain-containing protein [Chloroflexota bacterium]